MHLKTEVSHDKGPWWLTACARLPSTCIPEGEIKLLTVAEFSCFALVSHVFQFLLLSCASLLLCWVFHYKHAQGPTSQSQDDLYGSLESVWMPYTPGYVTRAGLWLETGSLGGWCRGRGPFQRWLAGAPRALWRSWSSSCGWRCARSCCRGPRAGHHLRRRETAGSESRDFFWRQPEKFTRRWSDNGDGRTDGTRWPC